MIYIIIHTHIYIVESIYLYIYMQHVLSAFDINISTYTANWGWYVPPIDVDLGDGLWFCLRHCVHIISPLVYDFVYDIVFTLYHVCMYVYIYTPHIYKLLYICVYIYVYTYIWKFPEMGVSPNHQF